MPWTPMQQAAIDKRHANILVSAAAGSGKTAVLTERVFNRIVGNETEEGIDIDRFLIVTFTSAAAHEMKERIADKISKAIEALQVEEATEKTIEKTAYLERQLTLLAKASISTIHSFCLKCIKNYFTYLEIDPNIKVGNESELQVMKLDILEEMLEEAFDAEDNSDFMELAETYGSIRGLEPLMELILDLHTFSKSTIFPNEWLEEKSKLEGDVWKQELLEDIFENLKDLTKVYEEALKVTCQTAGPALYEPTLRGDLEQIQTVLELPRENMKDIVEHIYGINFGRLPSKKQECEETLKERVKAYRELAKDVIKGAQGVAKLLSDPYLEDKTKQASGLMQTLVKWVKEFDIRFSEAKKDKGLVDYNDLEHMCLKLFVRQEVDETGHKVMAYTEVAKELADFYEEIYIDEYQDSNAVQETILGSIALAKEDGPTRFMVGDMKQSIYRFRLANPLIFAEKYHSFNKYEVEGAHKDVCIDLSQNFRSRNNILEATNDLFSQIMSERVGELEYDEDAKLKVGNLYDSGDAQDYTSEVAGAVELYLVETGNATKEVGAESEELAGEATIQELKNIELEALMVAKKIGALLRGEGNPQVVYDKDLDKYRKVEPKDIVILLRSVQDKANLFEEALLREGIDAYADVSSNFFDAMEVQIMLSLLQIIDNPKQDIPLLTVLRSPIVGLDFDEILAIRKFEEEVDFYTAMCHYSETGAGSKTLNDFMLLLKHYREVAVLMPLEELMARLLIETGYYQYVGMLPAGAKKKANLKLLKKYAEDFEANSGVGLFAFLQYIDRLRTSGAKVGEAKLVGGSENLVSIMTIHKSKGLEFPIVFVCNANKQFNNQDLMKNVLMHHELGLGPKYTDLETNILYETLPFEAIKRRITSENISEEMRVLYVALTRAKEKLFITGTVKDLDKEVQKWSQFAIRETIGILPLGLKKSPSYLNWIGMSLFAHSKFDDLRDRMGMGQFYLFKGEGDWALNVIPAIQFIEEQQTLEEKVEAREFILDHWNVDEAYSEHKALIYNRLGYTYPYMKATTMPVKVTVSDLKKQAMLEVYEESKHTLGGEDEQTEEIITESELSYSFDDKVIPRFMRQEENMQATVRGTLIHSVLEQIDFIQCKSADLIMAELDRLVETGKLHEEAARIVDVCKLERMATSTMIERMEKSKHVWKEKAFVYLLPANEVDETYDLEEEILLQGVVDTCFIEEEGLVIIDYKTDYVDGRKLKASIEKIKRRYQVQLDLYARALSEITGLPVKEKCLYLYHIDEWITLD
ncbi:helicase-exonuclease AddAB subunit AddA [Zhenhengia yiwuensis]|uniref:helicase-exonuclease AddAB subunit AddA n=1 Tax=Zhenhengia yiwuensis TaxID=2763666 RepID=UPI002A74CB6F|nr:helicase-exonuclease AddAB subunit AddA [Zhenhengia yiwuensis]MDY3367742.1 helicase-exonuclease AddAB subunit AddA [Zhenhengia yiwuensis]